MHHERVSVEHLPVGNRLPRKIGALVPPPRQHRHRYYGVLAPNSGWAGFTRSR
ncbi:MAG: hypothetical protein EA420_15280 [Candidatus Competibacteraceae bacterium]|nr:MAG: hypothetical protein EA420_15280 [Candidatus Competibacteraceae bacterium]